jgi:molybdate transport system ATP-binding protein
VTISVSVRAQLGAFSLAPSFEAPGGITALFGPSGSGKTLTVRCIAGLLRPESGRIALGDRVLFDKGNSIDLPARERRVGYLFQQYALFPHLDVGRNVGYGLHRLSRSEREKRVASLLALVGLEGFARRRVHELSGGQQQRVALARAMAPGPELLLLDEPFAAVDAIVRRQLRRELRMVYEQTRVPMLLVTHDLPEVRELADYVVIYHQGRVLEAGAVDQVLTSPTNEHTAILLQAASSG